MYSSRPHHFPGFFLGCCRDPVPAGTHMPLHFCGSSPHGRSQSLMAAEILPSSTLVCLTLLHLCHGNERLPFSDLFSGLDFVSCEAAGQAPYSIPQPIRGVSKPHTTSASESVLLAGSCDTTDVFVPKKATSLPSSPPFHHVKLIAHLQQYYAHMEEMWHTEVSPCR